MYVINCHQLLGTEGRHTMPCPTRVGLVTFGSEDMVANAEEDLATIAMESVWIHDLIRQEFTVDVIPCFRESSNQGDLPMDFFKEPITRNRPGVKFLKGEMVAQCN